MRPDYYTTSVLFLAILFLGGFACTKDETPMDDECDQVAFYRGTHVCFGDDDSAAVALDSANSNHFLILSNFFELLKADTLYYDDELTLTYNVPDSSIFLSGILCGAAIVAPVAEATCIKVE